jgi:hypothetical protein
VVVVSPLVEVEHANLGGVVEQVAGDPLRGLAAFRIAVEQDDDAAAGEALGPLGPPSVLAGNRDGWQPERVPGHGVGLPFDDPCLVSLERLGRREEVAPAARLGEHLRAAVAALRVRRVAEQVGERAIRVADREDDPLAVESEPEGTDRLGGPPAERLKPREPLRVCSERLAIAVEVSLGRSRRGLWLRALASRRHLVVVPLEPVAAEQLHRVGR